MQCIELSYFHTIDVSRPKRKRTQSIVVHRIGGGVVGNTPEECANFFLTHPEGVATTTMSPSLIALKVKEWKQTGIPESFLGKAFVPYHYLIGKDGSILYTLHHEKIGAHAAGHNALSIGIGFVGDMRVEKLTPAQKDAGLYKISYLQELYSNVLRVIPHDQVRKEMGQPAKNCPGSLFSLEK